MAAEPAGGCREWPRNLREGPGSGRRQRLRGQWPPPDGGQQKAPVRQKTEPGPFAWSLEAVYLVSGPSTGSSA